MDMLSDIRECSKITNIITLNSYLYGNSLVEINKNIFLSGTNGSGKTTFLNLIPLFLGTRQIKKDSNSYFSGNESSYIIIEYINYQGLKCSLLITQNQLEYQFFFFKMEYEILLKHIVIGFCDKLNFKDKLSIIEKNEIILLNQKHLQDLGLNKNEVVNDIDYSKYKMIIHENSDKKYKSLIRHFKFSNRQIGKMGKVMQELLEKKISFKTLKELIVNSFLENIDQKTIGSVSIDNCDDNQLKNNIDFYEIYTNNKDSITRLTSQTRLYLEQEISFFKYVNFLKYKTSIYKEELNSLNLEKLKNEKVLNQIEKEILKNDTVFNSESAFFKKELFEKQSKLKRCHDFLNNLKKDDCFCVFLDNKDNIVNISNELNSLKAQLNSTNFDKAILLKDYRKDLEENLVLEELNEKNLISNQIDELKKEASSFIVFQQTELAKTIASLEKEVIQLNKDLIEHRNFKIKILQEKQNEILNLAKINNIKIEDLSNPRDYILKQKHTIELNLLNLIKLNKNLENEIENLKKLKNEDNIYNFILNNSNYKSEAISILSDTFLNQEAKNIRFLSGLVNQNIYDIDLSNIDINSPKKTLDIIISEKQSTLNINLIEVENLNKSILDLKSSIEKMDELINLQNKSLNDIEQKISSINNLIQKTNEKILQEKTKFSNTKEKKESDFSESKVDLENRLKNIISELQNKLLKNLKEREDTLLDNNSLVLNEKIKQVEKKLSICQDKLIKKQYEEYLLNQQLILDLDETLLLLNDEHVQKSIIYNDNKIKLSENFKNTTELLATLLKDIQNLFISNSDYDKNLKQSEEIFKNMKFCNNMEEFLSIDNEIVAVEFNLDEFKKIVLDLNYLSEKLESLFNNPMTKDEMDLIFHNVNINKYQIKLLNIDNLTNFLDYINFGKERYKLLFFAELSPWVEDIKINHIEQLINDYFIELTNLVDVNNNYCEKFISFIKEFNGEITKTKSVKEYSYGGIKNLEFNISSKDFYSEFKEKRADFIEYFKDRENNIREFVKDSKEFIKIIKNLKDSTFSLMNSLKNEQLVNNILLNGSVFVNGNKKELSSKNLESDGRLGTSNGQYQLILYKLFLSFIKSTLSLGENDNIILHIPFDESLTIDANNLKEIFDEFNENDLFFFGVAPHANPIYLSIFNSLYFIKKGTISLTIKGGMY